jgi:glycosyltransferase involved in cell wall biosynthesis
MEVTLAATVLDAAERVPAFLRSIAWQTRPPDEVVVVDGGSTDGTFELLAADPSVIAIAQPGANIARGRNAAVAAATHGVIAVSDADCVLEPDWLEKLLEPLEAGADISMGFYRPLAESFLQRCMACVNIPDAAELDEATFMPSGRSVAFTREALERAGGYPEWLDIGEDMFVNHRFRELGLDMRLATGAIVDWPLRDSLGAMWWQYFRYARGDATAGMYAERHALRLGVYSGALWAWSTKGTVRKLATIAGAAAYASTPLRRVAARFEDPAERAKATLAVPALMAFVDAAKIAGYLAGLPRRRQPS